LPLSDHDLVDITLRARQFDIVALGQLYDHYYPQIFRYAIFRLGDEQTCREIIAQVFSRFIVTLKKRQKSIDEASGWLFETTRHLVDDHLSQKSRNPAQIMTMESPPVTSDPESINGEIIWLRRLVCKSLQLLIPEQQHLLALRFAGSCSPDETARMMGININDVKTIQFEALLSLRRLLEHEV
jgi:RNA polymerase sigma-70 factor, ECF subfamily